MQAAMSTDGASNGLIGEGSGQVNSQLVPRVPFDSVNPLIFGGTYSGPAGYPQQGVYQVPPIPPAISDLAGAATYEGPGPVPVGGGGGTSAPTSADMMGNVFSPSKGPVVMALLFLVVSLIGLQWIHWRKG